MARLGIEHLQDFVLLAFHWFFENCGMLQIPIEKETAIPADTGNGLVPGGRIKNTKRAYHRRRKTQCSRKTIWQRHCNHVRHARGRTGEQGFVLGNLHAPGVDIDTLKAETDKLKRKTQSSAATDVHGIGVEERKSPLKARDKDGSGGRQGRSTVSAEEG
jgi:hypothetical protein